MHVATMSHLIQSIITWAADFSDEIGRAASVGNLFRAALRCVSHHLILAFGAPEHGSICFNSSSSHCSLLINLIFSHFVIGFSSSLMWTLICACEGVVSQQSLRPQTTQLPQYFVPGWPFVLPALGPIAPAPHHVSSLHMCTALKHPLSLDPVHWLVSPWQ